MKLKINKLEVTPYPIDRTALVTMLVPLQEGTQLSQRAEKINKGGYVAEVKKPRKSDDMNKYMWVLCGKLAEKISYMTKEDAYRHGIKSVGKWVDVTVPKPEAQNLVKGWQNNGIGWFAEFLHYGDHTVAMRCYIGSSVYEASDLRRLTNFIVEECKGLGIETMTPAELDHLEYLWSVM